MKMSAGLHWCQEGSHKPINTTSVPRHRLPFHSSRKNSNGDCTCSLSLPKHHAGAISLSMASCLDSNPIISPQELGLGSQQSKGHPSAFTPLEYFVCCLLLCIWAWQHTLLPRMDTSPATPASAHFTLVTAQRQNHDPRTVHNTHSLCYCISPLNLNLYTVKTNTTTSNCNLCTPEIMT